MVRTARLAAPLFGLRREIDRLFEDTFGNVDAPSFTTSGWMPLVDVKETVKKEEEGKFHIVERSFGAFRRSFQLPTNVQEDRIEATVKDGVLMVKVPKMELPKPKKIEVKAIKG